jgi:hypothetical protein
MDADSILMQIRSADSVSRPCAFDRTVALSEKSIAVPGERRMVEAKQYGERVNFV